MSEKITPYKDSALGKKEQVAQEKFPQESPLHLRAFVTRKNSQSPEW